MRRGLAALAAALAATTAPAGGFGQEPSVFSEEVSVRLVLVPAVVRRGAARVRGLDVDDFELRVDGRPVPIETFETRADAPLSLVVMQDLSGSMANQGKLAVSRQVAGHFIDRAGPGDEIALASFASGRTSVEVPFTADRAALREALAAWEGYGTTGLYDAVARLPRISARGRRAQLAALLLTDGVDNASEIAPAAARELVGRAQLPVYVFGLGAERRPRRGRAAGTGELLRLLAERSGGRYYPLQREADWREAALDAAAELESQYVLGFTPAAAGEPAHHRIELRVRGRNRRVTARQGYFGPPPAASTGAR